jgi:hypothetical protein
MAYITYILVFIVVVIVFIILYKIFKFLISILLIGVFVILAYFTNPTEEMHRAAVLRKAEQEDIPMRNKKVVRDNYYVFSLTKIRHADESKVVGAGGFTQVIIFSKP